MGQGPIIPCKVKHVPYTLNILHCPCIISLSIKIQLNILVRQYVPCYLCYIICNIFQLTLSHQQAGKIQGNVCACMCVCVCVCVCVCGCTIMLQNAQYVNSNSILGFLSLGDIKKGCIQGGGCRAAAPQNPTNWNFKHRFCRYYDIKRFMWFTFQPESATEFGKWLVH
jgi:hypothetical protein